MTAPHCPHGIPIADGVVCADCAGEKAALAGADPKAEEPQQRAADIAAQFLPGTHGCHEAMHMASVLAEMVEERLCEHLAVQQNERWTQLANDACDTLHRLYQEIGREHMQS